MPKGIPRDKSLKRLLVHRLKITCGHLDKVIEMVEGDEYCVDVLNQSRAVQQALKKIDEVMLENHLKCCATQAIKNGNNGVVEEIMKVFRKTS